jgi:hypothetical protein
MQAVAAELSGLRRRIPLLFREKSLETVCFDASIVKKALKQTRSVCLRAFWPAMSSSLQLLRDFAG